MPTERVQRPRLVLFRMTVICNQRQVLGIYRPFPCRLDAFSRLSLMSLLFKHGRFAHVNTDGVHVGGPRIYAARGNIRHVRGVFNGHPILNVRHLNGVNRP